MTTIHPQIAASHETTRIADQEDRCASVLLRRAQLAQHVLRWPISSPLGVLLEECPHHCGYNVAWRDGVHTDPVGTPF